MRGKIGKLIAVLSVAIVVLLLAKLWLWFQKPFVPETSCKVVMPETTEVLYFRSFSWGVAGGHWQTVLSTKLKLDAAGAYDPDTEYLFDHHDGILYRVYGNT